MAFVILFSQKETLDSRLLGPSERYHSVGIGSSGMSRLNLVFGFRIDGLIIKMEIYPEHELPL